MGRDPGPSSWRSRVFLKASGQAGEVHLSGLASGSSASWCLSPPGALCLPRGWAPAQWGRGRGREASLWNEHICRAPPSSHKALSQLPHRSPRRPPRSPQVQNKTTPQTLPFLFPPQDINPLSVSTACPRLPPPLLPPAPWEPAG